MHLLALSNFGLVVRGALLNQQVGKISILNSDSSRIGSKKKCFRLLPNSLNFLSSRPLKICSEIGLELRNIPVKSKKEPHGVDYFNTRPFLIDFFALK